jgi:hypothetical protein
VHSQVLYFCILPCVVIRENLANEAFCEFFHGAQQENFIFQTKLGRKSAVKRELRIKVTLCDNRVKFLVDINKCLSIFT